MRVLITRPEPEAAGFADTLRQRGFTPVVIPLLDIVTSNTRPAFIPDTLIVTSRQAAPWAAAHLPPTMPVLAVGEASADAMRQAGFTDVSAAKGDVAALVAFIKALAPLSWGRLLYARGEDVSTDLPDLLAGYDLTEIICYGAREREDTASALRQYLEAGTGVVTLFSARTGAIFARQVAAQGAKNLCRPQRVLCFADTVLQSVRFLPWYDTITCEFPRLECMYRQLELLREKDLEGQPL